MPCKPRLIVFDLDYTLWPFYVDCNVAPPFRKDNHNEIIDIFHNVINCYPEVPEVLRTLHSAGYKLAIASRSPELEGALSLISLFGWDKYFGVTEIYRGNKTEHFKKIRERTGIEYKDMMFFDDEARNIADLSLLGVNCVLVKKGVTKQLVKDSLKLYQK